MTSGLVRNIFLFMRLSYSSTVKGTVLIMHGFVGRLDFMLYHKKLSDSDRHCRDVVACA